VLLFTSTVCRFDRDEMEEMLTKGNPGLERRFPLSQVI
jgi:hypothetical protein